MPNESPTPVSSNRPAAASTLDHLALLRVRGADARTFLDSQLTRNVPADPSVASPFGYCSPKGRLLASGVLWADRDAVSLLVSRDIADGIAKRLRMYVLRAKATIDDATASTRLVGRVDAGRLPAGLADTAPWTVTTVDADTWIHYPDAGSPKRYLVVGPRDEARDPLAGTLDAASWRWRDIRAGLPRITAATQERFVPQMLNLEALGGVDFKKGCFPGQEIVARSQYLGKQKRRMTIASIEAWAAVPSPGTDVWRAGDSEACGLVVDSERGPHARISLLIELPLALFSSSDLKIGADDGPSVTIDPLPYELPANEVFVRPKL